MPTKVPLRSKLDKKFTWNAETVFPSDEAWEREIEEILEKVPAVKQFQGRLIEGPQTLPGAHQAAHELISCAQGFGPNFDLDQERVGMTWSTFSHLFSDYYVYVCATGISGAHALAGRILRGEPTAVDCGLAVRIIR